MKRRTVEVCLAVSSLLLCMAFADGDSRKPSPAEKEFNASVMKSFAAALPSGPAGWEKSGGSDINSALTVVYSEPNEPIRIEYYSAWQDTTRIQAAEMQKSEELMKLAKKPGFTAKEVDALEEKLAPRDVTARIDVAANMTSQSIYDKVAQAPSVGGGLVYRSQGGRKAFLYVFLGKAWKTSSGAGGTYVTFTFDKSKSSSTSVQNIVVKIQAEPGRADDIARSINWAALNAMTK